MTSAVLWSRARAIVAWQDVGGDRGKARSRPAGHARRTGIGGRGLLAGTARGGGGAEAPAPRRAWGLLVRARTPQAPSRGRPWLPARPQGSPRARGVGPQRAGGAAPPGRRSRQRGRTLAWP